MPSKKSKYPPHRPPGTSKIFVRCWFCDGPSPKGCPNPASCRYIHPTDRDWVAARGAPKLIRCNYFFDNGMPKGNGCPLSNCSFLHPAAPGWVAAGGRRAGEALSSQEAGPKRQDSSGSSTQVDEPPKSGTGQLLKNDKDGSEERTRKPKAGAGRCRFYDVDGHPVHGGCPWKGQCSFIHPSDPEWNTPLSQNYKTIRCAFVDGDGKPLHGGCKHPKTCTFLHPDDIGWENAPRLYKTSRCNNYDDNGREISRGCPHPNCTYIHPTDKEWADAPARPSLTATLASSSKATNGSPPRRNRSPPRRQWGGKELPSIEFKENHKWSLDEKMRQLDQRYPRRPPSPPRGRRYDDDDDRRNGNGRGRRSPSPRYDDRRGRDRDRRSPGRSGRRSPSPGRYSLGRSRSRSRSRSPARRRRYGGRRSPSPRRGRSNHKSSRVGPSSPKDVKKLAPKQPGSNPADVGMTLQVLGDVNRCSLVVQALARAEEQLDEVEKGSKSGFGSLAPTWTALETLAQFFPIMSVNYEGQFLPFVRIPTLTISAEGIYSSLASPIKASVADRETVADRAVELQRHLNYLLELINAFERDSGHSESPSGPRPSQEVLSRTTQIKARLQRISTTLNLIAGDLRALSNPSANMKYEDAMDVDQPVNEGSEEPQDGMIGKWWRNFKLVMARFGALKDVATAS